MYSRGQGIRHIGVGGHHKNSVAYNAIKNVVIIDRTMMIRAAIMWPDASYNILWPMDMDHAIHLHNHTPYISSGISPEEFCTSSKSSHSYLQNDHPWGFPAYVLEPRLQYMNKFPKWIPRSRRAQYLGALSSACQSSGPGQEPTNWQLQPSIKFGFW